MAKFNIVLTGNMPVFQEREIEAENIDEALMIAYETCEDHLWEGIDGILDIVGESEDENGVISVEFSGLY